jgi:cysteine-rich repeat protein
MRMRRHLELFYGPLLAYAIVVGCSGTEESSLTKQNNGGTSHSGSGGDGAGEAGEAGAGGEGGELPAPPGDTCLDAVDADAVGTVNAEGALVVAGTNVGAHTDLEPCDSYATLADVVYRYTAPAAGGLRWALDPSSPTRFMVDVRTSCQDLSSNVVCDDCGSACGSDIEVSAGDSLYFAVFGTRTTGSPEGTGEFELSFALTPNPKLGEPCVSPNSNGRPCPEGSACQEPVSGTAVCGSPECGDGFLGFEFIECEDGNTEPNDGCSATCQADVQGAGSATCDAQVMLNLPRIRGFNDATLSYAMATGDFVAGSDLDASCSPAKGAEAVYVIDLTARSHVELTAENSEVLSVRRAVANDCGSEELACATNAPESPITIELDLEPDRYAIILDREQPTAAISPTYTLTVVIEPL